MLHPAVYCTYTGPLTFESRCEAALRYAGPHAALDGATAAEIHGLGGFGRDVVEVVVPHDRKVRSQPGLVVRRSRTLTDIQVRKGFAVVRVERAVLRLGPDAVTRAVQQGLTTPARLRRCLAGLGRIGGKAPLLVALDDLDGGSQSWLESRFAALLRAAGLPEPARNHPLAIDGRNLRIDACYVEQRVAIELDGRAYHLDREADLRRQNAVVLDGWLVLRFTARDLRERPDEVVSQVRRALEDPSVAECWDRSPVHALHGRPGAA